MPSRESEKAENREKDRPDLQRLALFHHGGAVHERRAGDPGHQRGVLDRIPEPEAAPAERVIGPIRPHRDAERQRDPGEERPGANDPRPGGVDASANERRGGERKHDREADIAEIEQRRMDREAGVLQNRIEIAAFPRRRRDARERIRGLQNKEQKRRAEQALHGERVGAQLVRHRVRKDRDQRAAKREDKHPKQHRAFVVPPDAGDFIDERLQRMGVLDDVDEREVGNDMRVGQRAVGERDEQELCDRRWPRDPHQPGVVQSGADEGNGELRHRQRQRQNKRIMSGLNDHADIPRIARKGAHPSPLWGGSNREAVRGGVNS